MVATLDDFMNNGAKNTQKRGVPTLDDFMNNGVAQSNVVTPRVTSLPKSAPAVQAPFNKSVTLGEGIGNLGSAIGEGVGNFVQTVANNPLEFAKDTANSLVVEPAKEFVTNVVNPDVTKSPWLAMAGGVAKGAIALPQNLWNIGVDTVNAYNNTPEQNQYKANYVENIANALQGNKLYQDAYQKPRQANTTIADLSSFAAPMALAGKVSKVANSINNASKVTRESGRIASKLTDAQRAKYASQIQKLAQNNVANETVGSTANNVVGNMATGFGLGALEGDTLQDRIANGTGMAALGLALTGGHAAAQKAWNSKRALELRKNGAETLNNLTNEYDSVSRVVAGLDNALNTNLSKNASDLTKLRKEYGELSSKNQNYKRNISDEEKALLDDAGKLSDEQQTEIFERNKYGARERALKLSKDAKEELASQEPQKHSTSVKTTEEAEKWFDDIKKREQAQAKEKEVIEPDYETPDEATEWWKKLAEEDGSKDLKQQTQAEDIVKENSNKYKIRITNENNGNNFFKKNNSSHVEGDLSHVKSKTDVVNPKQDETRLKNDSDMSDRITKLESGEAEGSNAGDWYTQKVGGKPKRLGDENMYEMQEVEGTKPTTDEELMQEIEAAKRQKDVPVVRSETKVDTRSASKRKFDRIHNEIKQKSWYKQLRNTKIKALNDDTKTKSMLDIVYEGQGTVSGSSPKMQSARKTAVSSNAKIKPYEGESQASNKAEFRDPNTLEEVEINKTNSNEGTTFEERINKIVAEKEAKASKRIENANRTISDNLGFSSYSRTTSNGKRQYSGKITTVKLKDVIKGDAELEKYFKKIGDIDVHIADTPHPEGISGTYDFKTKSITLFTDAANLANTIAHEARHAVQNQIIKNTWFGSRWRKLYKSCERRNEALLKFAANPKKMTIVEKVEPVYNDYKNKKISPDEFKQKVSEYELGVFRDFYKLYKDYRNTYLEVDARRFANGEHDKRLFHKGEATIRSELRTSKSKYSRDDKTRYGLNDFRDMSGQQMDSGDWISDLGKGQGSESDGIAGRHESIGRIEESVQREVNQNKLIYRTLNWFDKTKNNHTKFYHQFLEAAPEIKKFTDAFKAINDKREAFFREFGTYTDERMKARLYKQSKSGEGVYFQQGTKRNPKVEWGKESNDKVGFTGKKELEGILQKGTTQEGLARGFSDIVRMEHTRNRINFLKENFSKPQEGFVPVNSKLLANAMYFGKSKAWYETIRKGQEAIEKTFDEKNAKEWNELYKTTEADKSDIYIPKDLLDMSITGEKELPLDYLATYGKMRGTKGRIKGMAKVAGAMLDFYTDRFKRKVLTSASFFTNNRFGNQIMLAMTADKPQDYIKGIEDAFKLKESEVPTEILESTLAEAIQNESNGKTIRKYFSEKNNVFDNLARVLDGDEIETKSLSGFGKAAATASNWLISKPNNVFKRISHFTGDVNERWERFERKQAYSQALTKMQRDKVLKTAKQFAGIHELAEVAKKDTLIREAVIDKVADILGDYNNFSKFEKNVLKKLIPFYAWNRTITRHIINLAKDNPVKVTLVAFETYRLLNQDDGLEDYQHGSLKTGMKNNRTNSNIVLNKASMIPYNTLFDMVSGENIGSFSPLITKPLEAVRGEKFFKPASEITSRSWKRTTQDKKKGYVNTKTGEFREGKAPASVRAGYLAKDAMETVYPMAGSPMTKGLPDAVKHYGETGKFLFPDKQFDASLGGFYDGDKAGTYKRGRKTYDRKLSAKNRLDLKYQLANRLGGFGIQPEHSTTKEQKEKYARQRKRMQSK